MMSSSICKEYSPDASFWDVNPIYRNIPIFDKLWKYDRTKNKQKSSKIIWGMVLCLHPKSELYNLSDKRDIIATTVIGDKKFDWDSEENKKIQEQVLDIVLTQAEKSRVNWDLRMKKRDEFLDTQEYTIDNISDLDKANSATPKMYDEYMRISKLLSQEKTTNKKSKPISETARGDI